jgi:hypothetical protein
LSKVAVDTIIAQVAAIAGAITGIKRAHAYAPESLVELPAVIIVPNTGDVDRPRRPSLRQMDHNLKMVVLVNRAELTQADQEARPFIDAFIRAFDQHLTLNGTAMDSGITHYAYGKVAWGGVDYLGVEFNLRAVEREVGQYAP